MARADHPEASAAREMGGCGDSPTTAGTRPALPCRFDDCYRPGERQTVDALQQQRQGEAQFQLDDYRRLVAASRILPAPPIFSILPPKKGPTRCRSHADPRPGPSDRAIDLPQLGKKVFQSLALISQEAGDQSKGKEIIRRVLNNLASIVQGIAEIRNLYGTGHGQEGRKDELEARHAELVVGTAATLVTFLFSTHLNTPQKKASQRASRESQPKSENLAVHGGAESGG